MLSAEICQKIYITRFWGQKLYTLKARKLPLFCLFFNSVNVSILMNWVFFLLKSILMCNFLKGVVFWKKITQLENLHTTTSGDGRDKFQLCATPLNNRYSESSAVICFAKSRNFTNKETFFPDSATSTLFSISFSWRHKDRGKVSPTCRGNSKN